MPRKVSKRGSRSKGIRGELEACEVLASVWPGLKRSYHQARAGSDAPDIDGPGCEWWIEVKRQERIAIHAAMTQALKASRPVPTLDTRPPLILHKRNRGEWLVTLRAVDLPKLMQRPPIQLPESELDDDPWLDAPWTPEEEAALQAAEHDEGVEF